MIQNGWRVLIARLPLGRQYWHHWHWLVAPALLLLLYHRGLECWFHRDDFAALRIAMLPPEEFWRNLFEPRAQGTFRPLSERLFFYSFFQWFGRVNAGLLPRPTAPRSRSSAVPSAGACGRTGAAARKATARGRCRISIGPSRALRHRQCCNTKRHLP